jgi:hypothetical protein
MAAAGYHGSGGSVEDDNSDIGALWKHALKSYKENCDIDLNSTAHHNWDISTIEAEQSRLLDRFKSFRHSGSSVDKLRGFVVRNTEIIKTVATHIADAASAAFPPSAAIVTAFNYCLNASQAVSDDYDLILNFFDSMNSFLERMSLLEHRLPKDRAYQVFVVNVLESLLVVCAIAKKYRDEGRLKKWASALIHNQDPKLKDAYDKLNMHLQRLESATVVITLKTTVENSKRLDDLITGQETLTKIAMESSAVQKDMEKMMRRIDEDITRRAEQDKAAGIGAVADSGASKSTALILLRAKLWYRRTANVLLNELKRTYVPGTFDWVSNEPAYKQICSEETKLWCISGSAGTGKSMMAYRTIVSLRRTFAADTSSSVVYFFFTEANSGRWSSDLDTMTVEWLHYLAIQIAESDPRYREEVLTDITRGAMRSDNPSDDFDFESLESEEKIRHLLLLKFPKDSDRRLILILDGIDQVGTNYWKKLLQIIRRITDSESRIQIIFTCDTLNQPEDCDLSSQVLLSRLNMTKERLEADMKKVVWARTRRLPRLKGLSRIHSRIVKDVTTRSDSMRYIEYTLRRLDSIGREGLILKELKDLPLTTDKLYEKLLFTCAKGRTDDELAHLRRFFAWIAYCKRPISLPAIRSVLQDSSTSGSVDVDEELAYRSAPFLRISSRQVDEEEVIDASDEKDASTKSKEEGEVYNDSNSENDNDNDNNDDDADDEDREWADFALLVSFHDRSVRLFFRETDSDDHPQLRSPQTIGNFIIFEDMKTILFNQEMRKRSVHEIWTAFYAGNSWIDHLRDIKPTDLGIQDLLRVFSWLNDILLNKHQVLSILERMRMDLLSDLKNAEEVMELTIDLLSEWAEHAVQQASSLNLPCDVLETMEAIVKDRRFVYILFARAHIVNWFRSTSEYEALSPFQLAHWTLRQGRELLRDSNPELQTYLQNFNGDESDDFNPTLESHLLIANSFPDIKMTTALASGAVASTMIHHNLIDPGIQLLRSSLDKTTDPLELFFLHHKLGTTLAPEQDERTTGPLDKGSDLKGTLDGEDAIARRIKFTEAIHHFNKCITYMPEHVSESKEDRRLVWTIKDALTLRIQAEINLGNVDNLLDLVEESVARLSRYNGLRRHISLDLYPIVQAMAEKELWQDIIRLLKTSSKIDRDQLRWVLTMYGHNRHVERACIITGQTDYLLELYNEVEKTTSPYLRDKLHIRRAELYFHALRTPDYVSKAEELLNQVLDTSIIGKNGYFTDMDYINEISFPLADIAMYRFQSAKGLDAVAAKTKELNKLKVLTARISEIYGKGFDPSLSQLAIPLILMTRRMSSPVDFQEQVCEAFKGCLDGLRDSIGWNDRSSLRMLAKVLSCVDGMRTEASIAFTCQMYIVDLDVWKEETGKQDGQNEQRDNAVQVNSPRKSIADINEDSAEDIDPLATLTCGSCSKEAKDWKTGSFFLCYYCVELSLCADCYNNRVAVDKKEREAEWWVICPTDHKHIEAPVKGWRGVKNGVLMMEEDIKFTQWLDEVERKWNMIWERFWDDDSRVGSLSFEALPSEKDHMP